MMTEKALLCPCGSQRPLQDCCELAISGKQPASTAEALMRSRYTAYTLKQVDYLVQTTYPNPQKPANRSAIQSWIEGAQWHCLKVLRSQEGATGQEGQVEFVVFYAEQGQKKQHRELSTFKKEGGRWYYTHGDLVNTPFKIGRNEPCPCQSGKKYKNCFGK